MSDRDNITRRVTLEEMKAKHERGEIRPTREDAPTYDVPPEFWEKARPRSRSAKRSIHLRVDEDIYQWFKAQGEGHLTRMNEVLRSFVEAHRKPGSS